MTLSTCSATSMLPIHLLPAAQRAEDETMSDDGRDLSSSSSQIHCRENRIDRILSFCFSKFDIKWEEDQEEKDSVTSQTNFHFGREEIRSDDELLIKTNDETRWRHSKEDLFVSTSTDWIGNQQSFGYQDKYSKTYRGTPSHFLSLEEKYFALTQCSMKKRKKNRHIT